MNLDQSVIKEWDDLGFYYEYIDGLNHWRILGSRNGLQKFTGIIASYAGNPDNDAISEHIHIGPYSYLKIMTWHEPVISKEYIGGSLSDLLGLKKMIDSSLFSVKPGEVFKIANGYSLKNTAVLVFMVMADNFRPSLIGYDE
jgi:hypothetical protein